MRFAIRSLYALVPLAALPAPHRHVATPIALPGYSVTFKTTSSDNQDATPSFTLKFSGDKMRLEADMSGGRGGQGAAMLEGAYMLPQVGGKIAFVMPSAKMAMTMDVAAMAGRMGAGSATPVACPTMPKIDDLGAGESVLGHPTHHYKMHITVSGPDGNSESDVLLATDMQDAENVFLKMAQSFGSQFGGGESKCAMDALNGKIKGFPVKVTTSNNKGTTSLEATAIDKVAFNDADFEIPAGIQVMDAGAMMGGRGGRGRGGN